MCESHLGHTALCSHYEQCKCGQTLDYQTSAEDYSSHGSEASRSREDLVNPSTSRESSEERDMQSSNWEDMEKKVWTELVASLSDLHQNIMLPGRLQIWQLNLLYSPPNSLWQLSAPSPSPDAKSHQDLETRRRFIPNSGSIRLSSSQENLYKSLGLRDDSYGDGGTISTKQYVDLIMKKNTILCNQYKEEYRRTGGKISFEQFLDENRSKISQPNRDALSRSPSDSIPTATGTQTHFNKARQKQKKRRNENGARHTKKKSENKK